MYQVPSHIPHPHFSFGRHLFFFITLKMQQTLINEILNIYNHTNLHWSSKLSSILKAMPFHNNFIRTSSLNADATAPFLCTNTGSVFCFFGSDPWRSKQYSLNCILLNEQWSSNNCDYNHGAIIRICWVQTRCCCS